MVLKFSSSPKHSGIRDFHGQVYPRSTSAVHCDSKSFASSLPLQFVNPPSSAQKALLKHRGLCLAPDIHRVWNCRFPSPSSSNCRQQNLVGLKAAFTHFALRAHSHCFPSHWVNKSVLNLLFNWRGRWQEKCFYCDGRGSQAVWAGRTRRRLSSGFL